MAYRQHVKYPGFVEHIDGRGKWIGCFTTVDTEYSAEMTLPLPAHARQGSRFTIHQTKNGATYVYWITRPLITKRQLKKARQRAKRWAALFAPAGTR